jgi:hypothetical protein
MTSLRLETTENRYSNDKCNEIRKMQQNIHAICTKPVDETVISNMKRIIRRIIGEMGKQLLEMLCNKTMK